jgi:RNA polymerase sigma-70 factor (ECF subfamily)
VDVETVIRARQGDEAAFARLVSGLASRLHGVAYGILRDRILAEDATQQALVAMWRELPRLREPERFEAWATRILINACHSEGRRVRRWITGMPGPLQVSVSRDALSGVVDRDQLERGLRRLSLEHRTALVLRYYLDLPAAEIASVLGVPEGTVGSRLHRAMAALRANLEADARLDPASATSTEPIR